MYLNFRGSIKFHQVKNLYMVNQFPYTVFKHPFIDGVDDGELIWMHRYSHIMISNEVPNRFELLSEVFLPVELADRVGGERNKIRGYPKEKDLMLEIEP